ncbi:MAG: AsmA family protein, partial [Candidatus Aminicenantes bacterium]|nr:AsmA family protein [Candidatus Aminicenantes bacterium]
MNKKRVLRIAGGAILAVIVLTILVLLFGANVLKPRIEAKASTALRMDVRIRGGVRVSFLPAFGASLADISVKNGGADVATIAKVKVALKLLPLLVGRIQISRLELVKPVVTVVRQKDGTLNIEMPRGKPSGKRIALKKIAVSEGSLIYTDLRSGGNTEWEGIDITIMDLFAGGTPGGDTLKTLSLTGDIRCRAIKAGRFTLNDIEIKVTGAKGVCDIRPAGKQVLG